MNRILTSQLNKRPAQRAFATTLLIGSLTLSACATTERPKFQKAEKDGGLGYTVTGPIAASGFTLKTELGEVKDLKFRIFYGYRAVGEECLKRGFEFYDVSVIDPAHFEGYCYKTADHPALAIEFKESGLDQTPQRFFIGNLHGKTKTNLKVGDEIVLVDGVAPLTVSTFQAIVFRASSAGKKAVRLKIWRGDQQTAIEEPIALFKNSSLGATQLDLMRSRID